MDARALVLEAQAKLLEAKTALDAAPPASNVDRWELVNQLDFTLELAMELSGIADGKQPNQEFWTQLATR